MGTALQRSVVVGERVQNAPPRSHAGTQTSSGSYGRAWEANWQDRREAEIESDRRREMERAAAGELQMDLPDPAPTLPHQQLGWPTLMTDTPAAPPSASDSAPTNASVWSPRASQWLRQTHRHARSASSETRHGSASERSEAKYIVSTQFLRYCSEHGLLSRRRPGTTDAADLSGFGSTDGSTERRPVSSRSALSRTSESSIGLDHIAAR